MRRAPSSAVGTGFQTDLAGNDLSLDNVDPKRRRLLTGPYELDSVRPCRQRQRLEAAAERARETYVAAIDEDEGLGWDDCETDSSLPRFKWTGGISFAVVPSEALVFVDGSYVGLASSFGGS